MDMPNRCKQLAAMFRKHRIETGHANFTPLDDDAWAIRCSKRSCTWKFSILEDGPQNA